eukprot:CCRYP_002928-RA/>CCRYP_002928-RA protein AED:0.21 eAED:0.24 QI:0/0/0/1/0/0/4/0/800
MSPHTIKQGIINGSIRSAVSDTGATLTAGNLHDPFIHSNIQSTKTFMLPAGTTTTATTQVHLHLNARTPANTADIVPNLHQTLLSGSKFADANYTAVYNKHEVNFYDSDTINIPKLPLHPITVNETVDTLILDSKCGLHFTNPRYRVPTPTHIHKHLQASLECNTEHILNVYKLPSITQSIRYLHAAAGSPTKLSWLSAIRKGNYSTWPLINVKNIHKHFPQSEETQQGHMRNQQQGTRSTKQTLPQEEPQKPLPQLQDIFIRTYNTHSTLYTDQTGKFPHLSSQINWHQMILYHVDSNSILAEPNKNKTKGKLILARNRALQRMKASGIYPIQQVLDNEISAAYKLAITNSGMAYQLRKKPYKPGRITSLPSSVAQTPNFLSTFGANYYHKWNAKSVFYGNLMHTLTFPPIHISTAIMITTCSHSYPSAWKPVSTTNPTAANHLHNTASKVHHQPLGHASGRHHSSRCKPVSSPHKQFQAHHNNNVQQTDLTRLQILTQPPPPQLQPEKHAPRTWNSPSAPHPSTPPAVSDYDSDSSDSDDESVTTPQPLTLSPPQSPRVTPLQTMTPLPRVSTPPTSPVYNTHSHVHSITQETILHLLHNTRMPLTPQHAATQCFPRDILSAILDTDTGELLDYRHLIKNPKYCTIWKNAYGKELGCLAQGIPVTVKGTNTIVFIAPDQIPPNQRKDIIYGRICANYRPEKDDPYRIRLTVGSNRITYPGNLCTPTADMLTTKVLLNSVISTKGASFMTIDIKDFYLNTPMVRPEYMQLKLFDIPDLIIALYKLDKFATTDGYVYVLI